VLAKLAVADTRFPKTLIVRDRAVPSFA